MTKKDIAQEEERVMLNHMIADLNGRAKYIKSLLDNYNRDWNMVKKKLDKHFKKYGIEEENETD